MTIFDGLPLDKDAWAGSRLGRAIESIRMMECVLIAIAISLVVIWIALFLILIHTSGL